MHPRVSIMGVHLKKPGTREETLHSPSHQHAHIAHRPRIAFVRARSRLHRDTISRLGSKPTRGLLAYSQFIDR
jgi:hypothetical protein